CPGLAAISTLEGIMTPSRIRCWLVVGSMLGVLGLAGSGASAAGPQEKGKSKAKAQSGRTLKFETYQDKKQEHRWRLKATNGQVIATSGQGYKDKRDCENAIDVIKKGAEKARVEEASE
ncbi:MAG TPA: DUF1508 domain-containing protein, partial [Acidimicrobiales bacterium]|nr:DUF1508 domain-containing protein [Acidimicrobiales bacterium]